MQYIFDKLSSIYFSYFLFKLLTKVLNIRQESLSVLGLSEGFPAKKE